MTITVEELYRQAQQLSPEERRKLGAMLVAPTGPTPATVPLVDRLRAVRERIVASGEPLLNWSEIAAEVAERRGER
jgi:hypothetical protein